MIINHWVFRGTQHFQTYPNVVKSLCCGFLQDVWSPYFSGPKISEFFLRADNAFAPGTGGVDGRGSELFLNKEQASFDRFWTREVMMSWHGWLRKTVEEPGKSNPVTSRGIG